MQKKNAILGHHEGINRHMPPKKLILGKDLLGMVVNTKTPIVTNWCWTRKELKSKLGLVSKCPSLRVRVEISFVCYNYVYQWKVRCHALYTTGYRESVDKT